jgi:hypothetical protein
MRRFRPGRPSPALVVSIIALVAALGGTSYAAFSLPKHSVGSKQLKNNAVTQSKIKNGAVTGSKMNFAGVTVPSANHANSATNATNATNAGNATRLGGQPASAYQPSGNVLFASVNTSATTATVVRGRGATGAGRIGTGIYFVSFNRNILGCTWLGTYGVTDTGASGALNLTVEGRGTTTPNDVEIRIRNSAGTPTEGVGFHLSVFCP